MPSPRPTAPRRSAVDAFTLTAPGATPRAAVRACRIPSMWGAKRGRSAMTVASTCATAHPCLRRHFHRPAQQPCCPAPLYAGSVSGKAAADVPEPRGPEDAVGNGMGQHVRIGMPRQPFLPTEWRPRPK